MKVLLSILGLGMLLGGCVPGEVIVEPANPVIYSDYPYDYGPDYFVVDSPVFFDGGGYGGGYHGHHRYHHHRH